MTEPTRIGTAIHAEPILYVSEERPPPRRAFKFLSRADAPKVYGDGTLFLTDAERVRRIYEGGDGYADPLEMAADWALGPHPHVIARGHPLLAQMPSALGTTLQGHSGGTTLRFFAQSAVFCVCASASEKLQRRMAKAFGYDAYFEILELPELFAQLTRAVGEDAIAGGVNYFDTDPLDPRNMEIDPLRKSTRYGWQEEIRLVFADMPGGRAVPVPGLADLIGPLQLIPRCRKQRHRFLPRP